MNSVASNESSLLGATTPMRQAKAVQFRIAPLVFLALGILSVVLFYADVYFPIGISVLLMVLVVIYFILQLKAKRIGPLMALLLAVYLLPFIHIPPYLWFDFNSSPSRLWGLAVRPYMLYERIIELTAMLGTIGALGMAFGISLVRGRFVRDLGLNPDGGYRSFPSMSFGIWFFWLFIGVGLSWISAPQETIFKAAYTTSESLHENMNFSSAWMMSYVVLTFTFIDALIDRNAKRRALKWNLVLASIAFVFIWLQLLRGDRAAVPWIFSLALVYFYWAAPFIRRNEVTKVPWLKLGLWVFVLVFISMVVGAVRSNLTGSDISFAIDLVSNMFVEGRLGVSNMLHGTWSAVLLTPLSVAGDHVNGLLRTKWGETYWDIILSLPPGFIADAFDYERPLTSTTGLAWEMRYGLGGTHAAVAPFVNFGMLGVFVIPAFWSYIFLRYEKNAIKRISVINLSLLGSVVLGSAHWLWYGEKNGINALILWAIFAFLYRVSLGLSRELSAAYAVRGGRVADVANG
jgi:hypothetical protein